LEAHVLSYGAWTLDVRRMQLSVDGQMVHLQPGVLALLLFLVSREGQVISKRDLIDSVWGGRAVSDGAIYNRVNALRKVLSDNDGPERCIRWEYGRGLRFLRPGERPETEITKPVAREVIDQTTRSPLDSGPARLFGGEPDSADWQDLLGAYQYFYRTPSWPDAIQVGVGILTARDSYVLAQTIEQGQNPNLGIRRSARSVGHAEFIDGRIYIFERHYEPRRSISLTRLDAPHAFNPYDMTGMLMSSSWRLRGAPFATRVVWRRLPPGMTLRDAIRQTGHRSHEANIDDTILSTLGSHSFMLHGQDGEPPRDVQTEKSASKTSASAQRIPLTGPSTVGVLPFDALADDVDLLRLANWIVWEIPAQLSKFRNARITALSGYEDDLSFKSLADRWDLDYVLRGSLRPTATGVRVTVHLIDTASNAQIWANSYELLRANFLEGQEDLVRSIVASVSTFARRSDFAKASSKDIEDLSAWECFLRGSEILQTFDPRIQSEAIAVFQRGLELDPRSADLHAALSLAINLDYKLPSDFSEIAADGSRQTATRIRAHELANRSVDLDAQSANAWLALSRSHLSLGNFDGAISAAERALDLNPNIGWGYFLLGHCYWPLNRGGEALNAFHKAMEVVRQESLRWAVITGEAFAHLVAGNFEEALAAARRALLDPRADHFANCVEICSLSHLGRLDEARHAFRNAVETYTNFGLPLIEHDHPLPHPTVRKLIADGLTLAGDEAGS
ncbi:MAG: tetratricopeptide repeat protein, partial [Pseudomonadota bacterium]